MTNDNAEEIENEQKESRYERHVRRYHSFWEALIPNHVKLQCYGGMGLVNAGGGWTYGKNRQWETDLLFGIIPRHHTSNAKMTMTIKQNFTPWSIRIGNVGLEPMSTGVYFNTVFSDEFWTREPSRYGGGYYGFSTRVRTHVFLGQRLTYRTPEHLRWSFRDWTIFYEFSTCDLYVMSAVKNSYLKPSDYLVLSFGIKASIF